MLEDIHIMVARRTQENRSNGERWTMAICPNILRKVNKIRHATQYCHVLWNGASGFEVRDRKWRFTVDLGQQTCSCRYWQVSGIPCRRACAALFTMSDEPNNYVNACFSIDQYKTTYQHVLQSLEHESAWPVSPNPRPLPPSVKKMPGRPQTKRRMDPSERVNSSTKSSRVGVKIRCGRCHGTGHNSKTCSVQLQQNSTSGNNLGHSHGPSSSNNNNASLAIEPTTSKGKGPAASSSTKSTKRKGIEGYGLYYSERTGSSYIQTGKKSRLVSFGTSNSTAKASAVGNASIVIETSAGLPTSSAKATINVTGSRATAKIKSTSTARGGQKKSG